jgi:polysaccharide export outer membrane protein
VVWDHPELTAPFGSFNNVQDQGNVVREDGSIFYPFVGKVMVAGKTARSIQEELAEKLAAFIESPQLDVRVVSYRSQRFYITGMVSRPGTFSVSDVPVRVVEAIGLAGGLLPEADLYDVSLSRGEETFNIPLYDILYEGNLTGNALLQNGDVLHIAPNELRRVFVMGEVVRPLTLPMTNRTMSLTQALGEAGGIQETRANGRGVYVIRDSEYDGIIDVYQLDMSQAWALALGDEFVLQPRDIVYVSAAPITRWTRWVSNVLPSLQGLYNLDRISTQ